MKTEGKPKPFEVGQGAKEAELSPLYHFDTNILVHAVRADETWERIKGMFEPLIIAPRPCLSFAVHAEILSLATQWHWGQGKLDRLSYFLDYFECLDKISPKLLAAYAEIDAFSMNENPLGSIAMGKNDLWIAATAYVSGAVLLTTDRDFDHLNGRFFTRILAG